MHDDACGESGFQVEPIRSLEAIGDIKHHLAPRPRDLLLFGLGINNGARAGDLLRLTVNDVRGALPNQTLMVRQKHRSEAIPLALHPGTYHTLQQHLLQLNPPAPPDNMYLFANREGWTPLKTQVLDRLVREWTRAVGLQGTFGAHSLRKTFGYLHYIHHGVGLEVLARRFGHPSPAVTARYLGLNGDVPELPGLAEL